MNFELKLLAGLVLASVALLGSGVFIAERCEWVTESARIDRLRVDAKKVDSKMAEDVAGQVASANQKIAEKRRWRQTVWGIFIPAGWDDEKPIEMPKVPE